MPVLDRSKVASEEGLRKGGYILSDAPDHNPQVILIATGSELHLIAEAQPRLAERGIRARVVSMPSTELFDDQPQEYRDSVLPPAVPARLAVEAASPQSWWRYVGCDGDVIGVDRFGASAPGEVVMREYGFTVENVVQRAVNLVERLKGR